MTIDPVTGVITWPNPICDCMVLKVDNGNSFPICTCSYEVIVTVEDPCEFTDTVTFEVEVTCTICVDRLEVDPESMVLCVDNSDSFTLDALYDCADPMSLLDNDAVDYTYDTSIITVDNTGTITALACGETTIEISYTEDSQYRG